MEIAGIKYEKVYDATGVQRWQSEAIKYKEFDLAGRIATFTDNVPFKSIANIIIEPISYRNREIHEFHLEICLRTG